MKTKGRLTIVLLLIIALVIIYFGYAYSNQQQEKLAATAKSGESVSANAEETTIENKEVTDIPTYAEKRESLSVLDYIKYIELLNGEAKMAFYGQLPEEESWVDDVTNSIQDQITSELMTTNTTTSNTDSYELYITIAAQELAETNADVVFFMIPAVGDQISDISLDDSWDYLMRNINQIQEALPEALIVLVTPSPNSVQTEEYNSRMLSYVQYVENGIDVANESGLPLLDLHGEYLTALEENNVALETVLEEDGFILNPQGQDRMSELFKEQLTIPVDTTSGLAE